MKGMDAFVQCPTEERFFRDIIRLRFHQAPFGSGRKIGRRFDNERFPHYKPIYWIRFTGKG